MHLAFASSRSIAQPKKIQNLVQRKRDLFSVTMSQVIPWKLILSKAPVWAFIVSHFRHNWGIFILLTWMPTYYNQVKMRLMKINYREELRTKIKGFYSEVLKFSLTESGLLCVLLWLTMAVFANTGDWIVDTFSFNADNAINWLSGLCFLSELSHVKAPAFAVLCMARSQGLDAFLQSGLYSNDQDIGPRYSGVLLGLSNTAGVLAGVFGTAATGYILQNGSYGIMCLRFLLCFTLLGQHCGTTFSTGEKVLINSHKRGETQPI